MRKLHKERLKGVIGILLVVVAVAGIFLWETVLKQELTYKEVLVAKVDIAINSQITPDMLGTMRVPKDQVVKGRIKSYKDILGMTSRSSIPAKAQIYGGLFYVDSLTFEEGEYVCAIPKDWVYAFPDTLRRGDKVYLYSIAPLDSQAARAYGAEPFELSSRAELITSVTVAYVKDKANREVINVTADRMDGSSNIEKIEILVNEERYKKLERAVTAGSRLVLMYEQGV